MKISRRKFVAMSIAGVSTIPISDQTGKKGHRKDRLVVAVLEHLESRTNHASGAEIMLKRAGFEVINLMPEYVNSDISVSSMVMNYQSGDLGKEVRNRQENPRYEFAVSPDIEEIDMLFFGSFANLGQPYHDFLRRYSGQIPAFVKAGGIVVEMNQWARYSFLHPDYLPETMKIVRETWSGTDEIIMMDKDHALIKKWTDSEKALLGYPKQWHRPGRIYEGRRSWESIAEWSGMRVLLGAGGGYRKNNLKPGRAALVEGGYGEGRYLFSSLWLDKLFDEEGKSMAEPKTMQIGEQFFHALHEYALQVKTRKAPNLQTTPMAPEPIIGPALGHIDHEKAIIWLRGNKEGRYILKIWQQGQNRNQGSYLYEQASLDKDYCMQWHLDNLEADTKYYYTIGHEKGPLFDEQIFSFHTSSRAGIPAKTALAFGSCVDPNGRFSELWKQIAESGSEGMVLLGDTPYIDSTVSIQQRIKHREFLSQEGPAYLSKIMPFWSTWDDHDFGADNSDGQIHNRQNTRQVFKEYRALGNYGEMDEGIYTSFRRGPIEVFLLDTRYFSETEPSFAEPGKPTLIGHRQWKWLKKKLKFSNAPFKILAAGMTWDSKKRVTKTDSWESYAYEREAIIDFIGQNKITGVLLVGGDIHCTQVMKYATEKRIGYPLYHIVTSPMHERIIQEHEAIQHPGLLFARAEPNTFLKITANTLVEPVILTVEIINITGQRIYRLVTGSELNVSARP